MAKNAERDFEADIDALRADIAALTDSVGKLASEAVRAQSKFTNGARKSARRASHVGEEMWDEVHQLGADAVDAAADAAAAGMATLEDPIRRNPLSAMLIAFGVGFLIGLIGRR